MERTPTRDTSTSPPVIVPETSAEGCETTVRGSSKDLNPTSLSVIAPETSAEASADLNAKLQQAFDGLLGGESLGSFEEMASKEKVIVTLDKLLRVV